MGVPYDEILGNHSKGLPVRFYTLWADSSLKYPAEIGQKRSITSEQGKAAIKNTQPPISTKCPSDFEQTEAINCPPQQP